MSFSRDAPPQNFGVYFREFHEPPLQFQMRGDPRAGLLSLFRRLQQELPHLAGSHALHQVEKGAMLESPLATAILFPVTERMKTGQR